MQGDLKNWLDRKLSNESRNAYECRASSTMTSFLAGISAFVKHSDEEYYLEDIRMECGELGDFEIEFGLTRPLTTPELYQFANLISELLEAGGAIITMEDHRNTVQTVNVPHANDKKAYIRSSCRLKIEQA